MNRSNSHAHLNYVLDLGSYTLLFKPTAKETEVLQFAQIDYSQTRAEAVFKNVIACIPERSSAWSHAAAFVFIIQFKNDHLNVAQGVDGQDSASWFVEDSAGDQIFDFTQGVQMTRAAFELSRRRLTPTAHDGCPTDEVFELMQLLQPKSQRYAIDERITPANKATSAFIEHKQAMDYLYQQGVFGTFEDL